MQLATTSAWRWLRPSPVPPMPRAHQTRSAKASVHERTPISPIPPACPLMRPITPPHDPRFLPPRLSATLRTTIRHTRRRNSAKQHQAEKPQLPVVDRCHRRWYQDRPYRQRGLLPDRSASAGERRIITGGNRHQQRGRPCRGESLKLLNHGFLFYETVRLFTAQARRCDAAGGRAPATNCRRASRAISRCRC